MKEEIVFEELYDSSESGDFLTDSEKKRKLVSLLHKKVESVLFKHQKERKNKPNGIKIELGIKLYRILESSGYYTKTYAFGNSALSFEYISVLTFISPIWEKDPTYFSIELIDNDDTRSLQ